MNTTRIFHDNITKWVTLIFLVLVALFGWLIKNAVTQATIAQQITSIENVQTVDDVEDKEQEILVIAIDKRQAVMQKDVEVIQSDISEIKSDVKEVLNRLPR